MAVVVWGFLQLLGPDKKPRRADIRPPPVAQPATEDERRKLVDGLDARLLEAKAGHKACPLKNVWVPVPLGKRPVVPARSYGKKTVTATDDLESALKWRFDRSLIDIVPASSAGVGIIDRVVRAPRSGDDPWRKVTSFATLVVEEYSDPQVLGPIGEATTTEKEQLAGTVTTTTRQIAVMLGRVKARLVVWDYATGRFACASPSVEVQTPRLEFYDVSSARSSRRSKESQQRSQLLKARMETLIAVGREARKQLKSVTAR